MYLFALRLFFCLNGLLLLGFTPTCQGQATKPARVATAPVPDADPRLLRGTWQSLQDPRSVVRIDGQHYAEIYEGKQLSALSYELTNTCRCDQLLTLPGKRLLVTREADDCYCYSIARLDARRLTLTYLGRGNSLEFKRIK